MILTFWLPSLPSFRADNSAHTSPFLLTTARSTQVRRRLEQIAAGEAPSILREVDERERDKGTLCVGVRWEFERDDLREIVECLGGTSLEVISRMLSEEYGHRSRFVFDLFPSDVTSLRQEAETHFCLFAAECPTFCQFRCLVTLSLKVSLSDLFRRAGVSCSVWKYDEGRARFVEVKGPGDRLSSTQQVSAPSALFRCTFSLFFKHPSLTPCNSYSPSRQVWLDVLISAGVEVEVCKVVEAGKEDLRSMSRSVSPVKRKQSTVVDVDKEEEEGDEWDEVRAVEGFATSNNKKKRTST